MAQNLRTLIATAAELRSGGASWAAVARQVQRSPRTAASWPQRFPADWMRHYAEAQRKRFTEAADEALCCLRTLLRQADTRGQERAAVALLKLRPELPDASNLPELSEGAAQRRLAQLADDDRFDRSRIDAMRARQGLAPCTDLEFQCEQDRIEYQRLLDKAVDEEAVLSFDPHDYVKPLGDCYIAPDARGFNDPKTGATIPDDVMMRKLGYITAL